MSGANDIFCTTTTPNNHKEMATAVETFKSAVIRVRDILRGPGVSITGMESMRHICLYILSRSIDTKMAKTLEIPEEFAWEKMYETAMTKNGGVQHAFDCFFNKEGDCLVNHFDRLFGTEKFSFDIKNPQKHKEIMEIFNGVDMKKVDCQMDILGWVYEHHLKTGASSASRDLGQYFTDRFICEYMVKLCKPGFKTMDVPETVCDPTMGTGGFLTAYIKYFKREYPETPVDWVVQSKEIHGCDTDPRVAGVARLNLFMETGGSRADNLKTHDSLYGDLIQQGYDVILANMPFGVKGIKHAECCERVKNLKIRGTKSEPLFMQLIMCSLNKGGRCAVVVPDGMLENSRNQAVLTRKYLFDNFELKRVIKMEGKFFMNTGIKPSILFFENTGKPTSDVEFWNVIKTDKDEIIETLVLTVSREKFDKAYTLDVRRYQENGTNVTANPAGFPVMTLGDVVNYENGRTLASSDKDDSEEYDVMGGGMTYNGKTHNFNRDGETVSISKSGASAGFVAYHNKKYWAGDCFTLTPKEDNVLKYIYYYLKFSKSTTMYNSGSTIPHCKWDDVKDITIPIPPLEIQREIVATLDRIYSPGITELAETIKLTDKAMDLMLASPNGATLEPVVEAQRLIKKSAQMVADVKAQMIAVMKSVERRGFEMKKLGDVCKVSFGERITQKDNKGTIYPVYGSGEDTFRTDKFNRTGKTCKVGRFAISENNMVMFVTGPYWLMDSGFTVESSDETVVLTEYLCYCLAMDKQRLASLSTGSCQKNINMSDFYEVTYPIPPLDFQESLVSMLDNRQSSLEGLLNLQKQSEDNAKFILESYLSSPEIVPEAGEVVNVPESGEIAPESAPDVRIKKKKFKLVVSN